ncbi:hypothetical protein GCM10007216_20200 [Thalassobacillus devorans]|uniref:Probable nitronate monooxygenase n=1 Tax=Thalassobacillus devorans TaxID=279813 RepID=A0ABQ1P5P4_9BACI|nr:nitronate monooxygenase [Thalassobacillus devorans]NIK28036.1 nitronate monooxygenase [Thalassobacillus devorans]GGC89408.1 hypothetical protein GCM10007216_20200 [Thalassobacillus devorans]
MSDLPIIVAPMFLVSTPEMTIEAGKAGVIGSFPLLNARPAEKCAEWLEKVKRNLGDKPWAVNFICHSGSNKRYVEDFELIRKYEPPIVITSLGNPRDVIEVVHNYGGKVYSDVSNVKHAKKAAETGVDGLILVCAGAGGHGGTLNPFAFLSAVKKFYDGTLILAGGITTGRDVAAAKVMGADYAYMGTRFIPAKESIASEEYKQMILDASIEDILYTNAFSGVHANLLIPSLHRMGIDPKTLKSREDVDLSHLVNVKAWRDIWSAGHGVTLVEKQEPIKEIIDQMTREYKEGMTDVIPNH